MRRFRYEVAGTAGAGETFTCSGSLETEQAFGSVLQEVVKLAFTELTGGTPTRASCGGPYKFTKLLVEEVTN